MVKEVSDGVQSANYRGILTRQLVIFCIVSFLCSIRSSTIQTVTSDREIREWNQSSQKQQVICWYDSCSHIFKMSVSQTPSRFWAMYLSHLGLQWLLLHLPFKVNPCYLGIYIYQVQYRLGVLSGIMSPMIIRLMPLCPCYC